MDACGSNTILANEITSMIQNTAETSLVHRFEDVPEIPEVFPDPFQHEPHVSARTAAAAFQHELASHRAINKAVDISGVGKMFGVLVIKDKLGRLGYLKAFSGKILESNNLPGFVPPVFDTLNPAGFYKRGEQQLNSLNKQIEKLANRPALREANNHLAAVKSKANTELKALKSALKAAKKRRRQQRENIANSNFSEHEKSEIHKRFNTESQQDHYRFKDTKRSLQEEVTEAQAHLDSLMRPLSELKNKRKEMSRDLQDQLHHSYRFLNINKEHQGLKDIFKDTYAGIPPAGAGACCAPKLLQYAFRHELTPVSLAEFWWGPSPASEIRKHGHFYPPCRGKCYPILQHMLAGMPLSQLEKHTIPEDVEIPVLYEDESLLVISKPANFLSVPGKQIKDSVQTRLRQKYKGAAEVFLVHRLDMATSGILLVAKNLALYKQLQRLFAKRLIAKRYVAILENPPADPSGYVDLPLRVDLDDRPRQLVDYEHGKAARTRYEIQEVSDGKARVHLYPITGRTHQLRVHASHPAGLGSPIVGDKLYGNPDQRLMLHAEYLAFEHPVTGEQLEFVDPAPF